MTSTDKGTAKPSKDSHARENLEHWGLQLLRLAGILDQLNECKHLQSLDERGSPNRCLECSERLAQLGVEILHTTICLTNSRFWRPSETQRHLTPHNWETGLPLPPAHRKGG